MEYRWSALQFDKTALLIIQRGVDSGIDEFSLETTGAPTIRYSKSAAIACAQGEPFRLRSDARCRTAHNDIRPDAIAARLRANGLGQMHPSTLVRHGRITLLAKMFFGPANDLTTWGPRVLLVACQLVTRTASQCGLTMVANGQNHPPLPLVDAQRQRSKSSVR